MSFVVSTINQPTVSNGFASCLAGSKIVSFASSGGVVTVFDLATETTSAWQMTSPSSGHALSNVGTPWYDAASGFVWTFFSSTGTSALMFVRFDPASGATAYYPTSVNSSSSSGARRTCMAAGLVIAIAGGTVIRFDPSTGTTVFPTALLGFSSAVRPLVIGDVVYIRFSSASGRRVYDPTANTVVSDPAAASVACIANAQWAWSPVLNRWVAVQSGGGGVVMVHPTTAAETTQMLPTGFLGAPLASHDDGRLYSKWVNVACWDPVTNEVASVAHSGTSNFAVSYGGNVYFPVA